MKRQIVGSVLLGTSLLFTTLSADTITQQEKKVAKANYVLPSPFTLYTAFNKVAKDVKWEKYVSTNSKVSYTSETKIAYNIGVQTSKAFLLVASHKISDNNFAMLDVLSTKLGVEQKIVKRINTIKIALKENDKQSLKQELNYLNDDIKSALNSNERFTLASVMEVGSWLQAFDATTKYLSIHYTKDAADFIAQNNVIIALNNSLKKEKTLVFDPTTQDVIAGLTKISGIIGKKKTLSKGQIKKINYITGKLIKSIERN